MSDTDRDAPALTDAEVLEIAAAVRRLGEAFGGPQDVEWAIAGEERRLVILQARPITTLGEPGERRLWDNSNIVESYAGVTSPLTFSFARGVYEDVYRQFCALVGVSAERIDRNRHLFSNMLGLVRGRVYYNLRNWYAVLALLPGFALNREFMERMMGVRERLEESPASDAGKGADTLRLLRMARRLLRENRRLGGEVPVFQAHVAGVLEPLKREDLRTWSADRLLALYRELEDTLLRRWQTPIVNDFFAMIWFGMLSKLVERWLPDEPPTLVNDLLVQEGGVLSTEPARRVGLLTAMVRADPELKALLAGETGGGEVLERVRQGDRFSRFAGAVDAYLDEFGDRCANELKLETVTLSEDPDYLVRTLRGYLEEGATPHAEGGGQAIREAAEAKAHARLGAVQRRVFRLVLRQARQRVRDRENLRFERTRVFGLVRRIFLGFGHHFVRAGVLADPRDVFYLRIEEVFGHVEGTGSGDLRRLARMRREVWREHERAPPPPDRFESIGPPELGRWIARGPAVETGGDVLSGLGCCPGIVRAPVRIVRDPARPGRLAGHILVAERTDPGWTLLFPQARGILVERGSLLSHSAIVAREMGIPCVVAVPGLLATLEDGEEVEMDGATGVVRRV